MIHNALIDRLSNEVQQALDAGSSVVGYIYPHAPVELIMGHGLIPSLVWASPTMAGSYESSLQTFACSYIRNLFGRRTVGALPRYSALLFPSNTCDSLWNTADIWRIRFPEDNLIRLSYPASADHDAGVEYLTKELEALSEVLARITDSSFSEVQYQTAVATFSEFRRAAQFLYAARIVVPSVLPYTRVGELVRSFLTMPTQSNLIELKRVAEQVRATLSERDLLSLADATCRALLNQCPEDMPVIPDEGRPRLLAVGGMIEPTALADIVRTASPHGDSVLLLDMFTLGFKTVFTPSPNGSGDPFIESAESILGAPLEPVQEGLPRRLALFRGLLERLSINGVLVCEQSFCDPDEFESPSLEKVAADMGVHCTKLPMDPELSDRVRLEGRVQTLVEAIS